MSTILAGLYITAGLAVQNGHTNECRACYWYYDINRVRNPYGSLELGWSAELSRWVTFSVNVRHESSVPKKDFGRDQFGVAITWRPWR